MGRDDARAAGLWSDQLVVLVVSGAAESDVDVGQFSPSGFGWHGPGSLPGNPVGRSDVFHPASHQPSPREGCSGLAISSCLSTTWLCLVTSPRGVAARATQTMMGTEAISCLWRRKTKSLGTCDKLCNEELCSRVWGA